MELTFLMPTKIYFGLQCIAKHGDEFGHRGSRALIVTGRSSAAKSGALADVQKALEERDIPWAVFDQVEENPSFSTVEAGGAAAREHMADMIIGIGGGSPLDAAKAVAVLATNEMKADQLFGSRYAVKPLPIIAIPLTAGTGSEVTHYSILTDTERRTKRSFAHADIFPKAAFLDARYTESLPWQVTVNTAVDALSHVVEGYLSKKGNLLSDALALEAIRAFGQTIPALTSHTVNLAVREQLLYISLLGGVVIAQSGTTMVHSLGYSLTYFRFIPHGRANGLLLAEYLRFLQPAVPDKISSVLNALNIGTVDAVSELMKNLLGQEPPLSAQETEEFSRIAIQAANIVNTPRIPDIDNLKDVLTASLSEE